MDYRYIGVVDETGYYVGDFHTAYPLDRAVELAARLNAGETDGWSYRVQPADHHHRLIPGTIV